MPSKRNSAVAVPSPATPVRGTPNITPQVAREMLDDLVAYQRTQAMSAKTTKAHLNKLRGKATK
jgi:hypothetical protein